MEGVLRGFAGVALGAEDDGNQNNRRTNDDDAGIREQRSTTWAEVAASGLHDGQHSSQVEGVQDWRGESGGGDGEWKTVGRRRNERNRYNLPQQIPVHSWSGYKQCPSEQQYAPEVNYDAETEPLDEELADLSQACNKLWELDTNRLVPGADYVIDVGEGKKPYQEEDMASRKLFSWLSDDVFARPTFSRFCALLDNYDPDQGNEEVVTYEEKHEQKAFIEEISRTAPVKYLHKYLVAKGIVSDSSHEFKEMMTHLWFDLYNRGGTSGSSSAFEHVFVGEIKNRGKEQVSGFHNWIQFYLEEAKGRVDYKGYIFPRRRGESPDCETQLLTIQFEWDGILKACSSTLIGVSPEFEIALYTLCFFIGEVDSHVSLGPYFVNIKCHHYGDRKIGSVYPIAED